MRLLPVCLVFTILAAAVACGEGGAPEAAKPAASAAAQDAARQAAAARAQTDAAVDKERLADLWSYSDVPVGKGRQLAASIYSTGDVDTGGGGGPKRVELVFRDHPSWGRSSYLVLEDGDFNCYAGCRVIVTADDRPPRRMAAHRPRTDEAIAMFIDDAAGLWRLVEEATRIEIQFPVKAGGRRTAQFEVSGLVPSKLPGWGAPPGSRSH